MRRTSLVVALLLALLKPAVAQEHVGPIARQAATRLLEATLRQARGDYPNPPLAVDGDDRQLLAYGNQEGPLLLAVQDRGLTRETLVTLGENPTPVALLALRDMTPVDATGPVPLTRLAHVVPGGPLRVILLYVGVRMKGQQRVLDIYSRDTTPLLTVPLATVDDIRTRPLVSFEPADGRTGRRSLSVFLPNGERAVLPLAPLDDRSRLPCPREGALKVGDRAPDFQLRSPDGRLNVQLSHLTGDRPVVLIFGSYT